jgi:hypothetical protein
MSSTCSADSFSLYDQEAWENLGRIYSNAEDPVVQELWLLGRYHGQYHSTFGTDSEGYETRRLRYGAQARLFGQMTIHAQAISGFDINPFYNGFSELWIQWDFSPELKISLGQQKHRFTHDRNVSSRYLNYLERGMLTNMFGADYTPAVTAQGAIDDLSYYAGIFSNSTGRDMIDSFTEYDSGHSLLLAAYWDFTPDDNFYKAYAHFSTVQSSARETATNLDRFDQGYSAAGIVTDDSLSMIVELLAGLESSSGNSYGINIQPGVFLADDIQLVGRYQAAWSTDDRGLEPQRRYESGLKDGRQYQAGYLGLNYYLRRHRFKVMTGLEYARMDNEAQWTFGSMVRFYFGPHSGGAFPMNQMLPGSLFEFD